MISLLQLLGGLVLLLIGGEALVRGAARLAIRFGLSRLMVGMVIAGFVPSPLHEVVKYWPTLPEFLISLGIYAIGALIITGLYKMVLSVRRETA